jgi:hypothetical protein
MVIDSDAPAMPLLENVAGQIVLAPTVLRELRIRAGQIL